MSASESSTLQPNTPVPAIETPTNAPKVPVLGEGFQETPKDAVPKTADSSDAEQEAIETTGEEAKTGKRRLFGFGKKKGDEKTKVKDKGETAASAATIHATTNIVQPIARRPPIQNTSPPRSNPNHPYQLPASPHRNLFSSSPRVVSPAGSQIFERDVQESTLPVPNSPAIPSHIQTENHIPPVLDASSEAITNSTIDPDTVEIVMHSSHQPAAMNVTGVGNLEPTAAYGTWADDLVAHPDKDDAASNYGALDSTDVRRLSFISFSDIVQSEHAEHAGSRDSIYVAGLSSLSSGHNRSPSPIRSPVSSQGFSASPPTSKSASVKGVDMSPKGRPLGSPISTHAPVTTGELTIETMTQALRRTGSGDLSGVRSQPLSPSSPDGLSDRSFK
ncbi:hypothetical protein ONS95_003083 [Cadophora gregata]|uniref:uncharacterized protein n=1 Tax=Cadophora gregata TaxID=51156 RepID=UPI0026DD5B50|nr:uncharacterized protein ONS95_003083 [Cadophora gregata]KAK0108265.1 hypothetical protein ONS95_003083 [Cadophora gregata]KAK0109144.1 hypothetical protein ONS96_002969 [Cadophora gregata f. sp. sojae]